MDCERANELIPLYLDQSLDHTETNELRTHLLQCKACKQELIELEEIISKLQTMPKQALPLGYHEELMGKIRASASVRTKKKSRTPWMGAGVAAAVIAVAVYAGGGFDTMLQNKENVISNHENQKEIAAAAEGAEAFDGGIEMVTDEVAALPSSEEVFENMDEVFVLDSAEADAATGSLPNNLQGSAISSVVPSDEEFIIIDDNSLAGENLAGENLAGENLAGENLASENLVAPIVVADASMETEIETEPIMIDADVSIVTEPIIAEVHSQEAIQPVAPTEPIQTDLLENSGKTRSMPAENIVADTQEKAVMTANEAMIAPSEIEVAWETIPEEDPLAVESAVAPEMAQPLEAASEVPKSNDTQIPTTSIMETQSKESAIGLKNSGIISISISATTMQEVFQMLSDFVFAQGGMVLHEELPTGISDPNAPIIPENRILFKIPKAVYETTIAELSKFSIIGDYTGWEAPMDKVYEVLKQERNILEKNGYHDLEAQLAEYDRRIATWEQEEEYTSVYLTVLENKSAEE